LGGKEKTGAIVLKVPKGRPPKKGAILAHATLAHLKGKKTPYGLLNKKKNDWRKCWKEVGGVQQNHRGVLRKKREKRKECGAS